MKKIAIDLEPTWIEILNMVKSGHLNAEDSDLEKACTIADLVRKAQKMGANSITFSFEDGLVGYEEDYSSGLKERVEKFFEKLENELGDISNSTLSDFHLQSQISHTLGRIDLVKDTLDWMENKNDK